MKTSGWTAAEVDERQEQLADYFESVDPSEMKQVPVAEGYLRWAVGASAAAPDSAAHREELDRAAVKALREGSSPERVARIMGTTVEEVLHYYAAVL